MKATFMVRHVRLEKRGDEVQLIDFRKVWSVENWLANMFPNAFGAGGMGSVYRAVQQGTKSRGC